MKPNEIKNKILNELYELESQASFSGGIYFKSKSNFLRFIDQQLYECKDSDFDLEIYISLSPSNSIYLSIIKLDCKFSIHFVNDKTMKCFLSCKNMNVCQTV